MKMKNCESFFHFFGRFFFIVMVIATHWTIYYVLPFASHPPWSNDKTNTNFFYSGVFKYTIVHAVTLPEHDS